jgi:hypothetical protein
LGSIRRSWFRRLSGALGVSVAAAGLTGCLYGFAGGGLPNIKTVAIQPFDNQTPMPQLTQEVNDAIRQAFESRLGLRQAGEQTADALVRGRIVQYQADVPLAFVPGQGQAPVTRRQVQVTVDVEVLDQREGKTIWQRQGLTVLGDYQPPAEADGRKQALDKLVAEIVEGAQSQW